MLVGLPTNLNIKLVKIRTANQLDKREEELKRKEKLESKQKIYEWLRKQPTE